ncbi:hypothetical protein [Nocardia sp. NPDC056000]|uniref:hypothetical protein n=1 Tax=Nocardia sp. NPDC056000 TaxID=3345674 RepID=UPI0035DC38C9
MRREVFGQWRIAAAEAHLAARGHVYRGVPESDVGAMTVATPGARPVEAATAAVEVITRTASTGRTTGRGLSRRPMATFRGYRPIVIGRSPSGHLGRQSRTTLAPTAVEHRLHASRRRDIARPVRTTRAPGIADR